MQIPIEIKLTDEQLKDNKLQDHLENLKRELEKKDITDVYVSLCGNRLILLFNETFFEKRKKNDRNAGRKRTHAEDSTIKELTSSGVEINKMLRYTDIILKLNQGTDLKEMLNYTNMAQATYYRHLKTMKESEFYKDIDLERIDDQEYIKSLGKANKYF